MFLILLLTLLKHETAPTLLHVQHLDVVKRSIFKNCLRFDTFYGQHTLSLDTSCISHAFIDTIIHYLLIAQFTISYFTISYLHFRAAEYL